MSIPSRIFSRKYCSRTTLFICAFSPSCLSCPNSVATLLHCSCLLFVFYIALPALAQLIQFGGLHSGLPRSEFVKQLCVFPEASLKALRSNLFSEAQKMNLIPSELTEIPLISRRDSALRPIFQGYSVRIFGLLLTVSGTRNASREPFLRMEREGKAS